MSSSNPKVLLLVDDDPDDQDIFQEALKSIDSGIVFYSATDGKDAIRKLQDSLLLPDIIFVDLNMPVMNGKDLLTALKKDNDLKHIPVVVYSTSSAQREKDNCMSLGAVQYINKPSQFNVLVSELKYTLQSNWISN